MAVLEDYYWMTIVGGLAMFMTGFGIGANDVANNFGSAVGGKTISLGKAIILAAICEFIGAVLMGAQVTMAIRGNIVDMTAFENQPDLIMYGNLCSLIGAGLWLLIATHFGMPVSTTHSIVGALIGFGMASGRSNAVQWNQVGLIIASWFISPTLSLLIAMGLFAFLRRVMLRNSNPIRRGFKVLWLIIFLVCLVFSVFLVFSKNPFTLPFACLQTSSDGKVAEKAPCSISNYCQTNIGPGIGIALALAALLSLVFVPIAYYYTRKHLRELAKKEENLALGRRYQLDASIPLNGDGRSSPAAAADELVVTTAAGASDISSDEDEQASSAKGEDGRKTRLTSSPSTTTTVPSNADLGDTHQVSCTSKFKEQWSAMPWNQDIHAAEEGDDSEETHKRHDDVETFDPKAESFFAASQVISACCLSLAHGANDVANGTGPYAAIIGIYTFGTAGGSQSVPTWIMLLGGASIAIGLAFMGHKVIKTVGIRMIKVTASRGVVSDLATTLTVILFSFKVPLSSTHCKVGSNLGIGLIDKSVGTDDKKSTFLGMNLAAVNWKLCGQIAICWVVTLAFAGAVSAGLFAFGAYGPTLQRNYYTWNGPSTIVNPSTASAVAAGSELLF